MNTTFEPTAPLSNLYARARLYQDLRRFFAHRQVLEVETPLLSAGCLPDPLITSFTTDYHGQPPTRLFLQTSPEFAMKRLLTAYQIPIYQITKVFRDGEAGRWHNPEFTMLEWYRPGFTQENLIDEIDELLQTVLSWPTAQRISYCELFEQKCQLHPLHTPLATLQRYAARFNVDQVQKLDRDTCLQLILSCELEPQLGERCPLVITDFPASQAALARKNPNNLQLAERFEVYYHGIELANGFYELIDPLEQRHRFEQDLEKRRALGLPLVPLDERFLAALEAGLPPCAGVAVGLDRLLMIMLNASHIREVIAFPIECA